MADVGGTANDPQRFLLPGIHFSMDRVVYCTLCASERAHAFTFKDETKWENPIQNTSGGTYLYRGECSLCHSHSLYLERSYDSQTFFDCSCDENGIFETHYTDKFFHSGYPNNEPGSFNFEPKDRHDIPQDILVIVDETQRAKLVCSWHLWGAGVRMVLEASLNYLNVPRCGPPPGRSESLYHQINNYIDALGNEDKRRFARFLPMLHDLRLFGNDAVHQHVVVPQEHRDQLAKFVVAMLQFMFVIPTNLARMADQFQSVHSRNT